MRRVAKLRRVGRAVLVTVVTRRPWTAVGVHPHFF